MGNLTASAPRGDEPSTAPSPTIPTAWSIIAHTTRQAERRLDRPAQAAPRSFKLNQSRQVSLSGDGVLRGAYR
jgi:hypothetical protein